jgi:hypothetical protein
MMLGRLDENLGRFEPTIAAGQRFPVYNLFSAKPVMA